MRLPSVIGLLELATLPDGTVVDVALAGGSVTAVGAPGTVAPGPGDTLDLAGHVLLPAPAEPHAHIDKALTWDAIEPPTGDLLQAIEGFRGFAAQEDEAGIRARATAVVGRMLAAGTTAVRSHVNFFGDDDPLKAFRALAVLREEFAGLVDLQLVALPGWETPTALIDAALDAGADLVGGAPHLAPDAEGEVHRLLDIAERRGCGVDLHTDEGLDGPVTLAVYADRTRDWPVVRTAGHCVRLSTLEAETLDPLLAAVRRADIGLVALPITNLYLQGREGERATPRGILPIRRALEAGVRVGAGADNVRDPFNPMGRGDALETASLLVTAGHLTVEEAVAAVASGARSVMGLPVAGPVPGAAADLLAVRAESLADAVAFAPADRFVLHAGRLVAATRTIVESAAPLARQEARL